MKLFFEKVYLHIDRKYYSSGDDIWLKAYLINAQNNYLINTSNNLYVELINPLNKIITREVIRLDNGIGVGDFKLDDSIAGGNYRIRAYTNWMRNFGSHFVFEKEIYVKNIPGIDKENAIVQKQVSEDKKNFTSSNYKIKFFPEGGSMVQGIQSPIAFKAEDANGIGVDASGFILSAKNDTIVHFKTSHLGMGSFVFKPDASVQYKAFVQYKNSGNFISADLPYATPDGFVMKVSDADSSKIFVDIFSNAATLALHPSGETTIAAKHAGKIFYKEKLILKDAKASAIIDKKLFPPGIASITLYDENLHPYCERLVYIPEKNSIIINVTTGKISYESKEKITVNISVTDAQLHPVKANLSLAAIDDNIEKQSKENIISYFMLQSEVAGKIENSAEYFNEKNPQRFQQLDLLLRAQGWRNFLWRQLADTDINLKYLPEPGITISGKIKKSFSKEPVGDSMNVALQIPKAQGNKWYFTKSYPDGKYFFDGVALYGTQTIKINARNDKGKQRGQMFMDTLFGNPLTVTQNFIYNQDTTGFSNFARNAANRYNISKSNMWYHVLPTVTITSKKKTVSLRDGVYMNFGYPEYNFDITPADYKIETVQDFLVKKVPGCTYDVENNAVNFIASGKLIRPRFSVDKREDVFDRIDYYFVPIKQVKSISVRHLVGPPTFARSENDNGRINLGGDNTDIFIIYLELKAGAYNQDPAKIFTEVTGYYSARIFYSPNYEKLDRTKPDVRTTIHWEPLITTDANGKAIVNFYNADPKTIIRLDVQGISDKGIPVVGEAKYDVK